MINLTFFLTPIIIIVAVIVIEFWLRRKKRKPAGTTGVSGLELMKTGFKKPPGK